MLLQEIHGPLTALNQCVNEYVQNAAGGYAEGGVLDGSRIFRRRTVRRMKKKANLT